MATYRGVKGTQVFDSIETAQMAIPGSAWSSIEVWEFDQTIEFVRDPNGTDLTMYDGSTWRRETTYAEAAAIAGEALLAATAAGEAAEQASSSAAASAEIANTFAASTSDVTYLSDEMIQKAVRAQGQSADFSAMTQTSVAGSMTMIMRANLDAPYVNGGVADSFQIYLTAPARVSVSSWTFDVAKTTYYPHSIQYFDLGAGYHNLTPSVPVPKNGVVAFGADVAVVGVNSGMPIVTVRATTTDFLQFTQASTGSFRFMVRIGVTEPVALVVPDDGALTVATDAQDRISGRQADIDFIRSGLLVSADTYPAQSVDMSAMSPTSGAGNRSMVAGAGASPRYPNGGTVTEFEVYLTGSTRFSVSSWTEDVPGAGTIFTPHDVRYFDGVTGWNTVRPDINIPPGGLWGMGVTTQSLVGQNTGLPIVYMRTAATENEQFTQASTVNYRMMVSVTVSEPLTLSIPTDDIDGPPASLIDKTFSDSDGWTIAGASIVSGALESGANSTWATRANPTGYPYSQLSKRTLSAFATIVAASQIWGISSMRQEDGSQLDTPAAIVDGVANKLRVYRYDSIAATTSSVSLEVDIPWTLAGSKVRLDVKRDRFAMTFTLTNRVSGASVSLTADYAAGTGSNTLTGRPWGIPCVLMPSTTSGGVRIERVRLNADYPFPSAHAAKVICIGDSITEASQIGPDFDDGWAYLLESERVTNGSKDTVVAARGGQKSDGALGAIGEAVRLCGPGTVVIILIGTNDAGISSGSHEGWRANVTAMLAQIRTKTDRIAMCALPPGPAGAATKRNLMNTDIINNYFGTPLGPVRFDLALSVGNDGTTTNGALYIDPTHPNVAGNAVMLARLRLDCPEAFE